jgi:hypothetical protein
MSSSIAMRSWWLTSWISRSSWLSLSEVLIGIWCTCVFIWVSVYLCMSICVCIVFLNKRSGEGWRSKLDIYSSIKERRHTRGRPVQQHVRKPAGDRTAPCELSTRKRNSHTTVWLGSRWLKRQINASHSLGETSLNVAPADGAPRETTIKQQQVWCKSRSNAARSCQSPWKAVLAPNRLTENWQPERSAVFTPQICWFLDTVYHASFYLI